MSTDLKFILAAVAGTILIIGGGIFLSSKNGNTSNSPTVKPELLVSSTSDVHKAPNEKAVLVEFGDFECPACGDYHSMVKQLTTEFGDTLTFAFRNFPLPQHTNAKPASYAAEAAGLQGKYWEMHNYLFENQVKWANLSDPKPFFDDYAKTLGLDIKKFNSDMNSDLVVKKINADLADGNTVGISATPTFYLNGVKLSYPRSYDEFKKLVTEAINKNTLSQGSAEGAYHTHFDIRIFVNGKPLDLSQSKYQSKEGAELDPSVHLHDGNGKVVHIHKEGVTIGQLLSSLKINMTGKLFVNGKEITGNLSDYKPQDLDHVLIVSQATTNAQVQEQLKLVSNDACIYSLKCPDRGTPPPESCAGGLGTGCEK